LIGFIMIGLGMLGMVLIPVSISRGLIAKGDMPDALAWTFALIVASCATTLGIILALAGV
jgi:ABC-type multidrug transport system permease subunit